MGSCSMVAVGMGCGISLALLLVSSVGIPGGRGMEEGHESVNSGNAVAWVWRGVQFPPCFVSVQASPRGA